MISLNRVVLHIDAKCHGLIQYPGVHQAQLDADHRTAEAQAFMQASNSLDHGITIFTEANMKTAYGMLADHDRCTAGRDHEHGLPHNFIIQVHSDNRIATFFAGAIF